MRVKYLKEEKFDLYSKYLKKYKTIRVYRPKNDGPFCVLYMHDGQNIVQKAALSNKSWDVTKTLKRLRKNILVVGIDSDSDREEEYYAYSLPLELRGPNHLKYTPKAGLYLNFIVFELMPFINKTYPTLKGQEHTYLAGSSLGGFITAYCALVKKGVFSRFGVFSPAFALDGSEGFSRTYRALDTDLKAQYFLSCGDKELIPTEGINSDEFFIDELNYYQDLLLGSGARLCMKKIYHKHFHSEQCWKRQFKDFARFLD